MWIQCTDKHGEQESVGVNFACVWRIKPARGGGTEIIFSQDADATRWMTVQEDFDWIMERLNAPQKTNP